MTRIKNGSLHIAWSAYPYLMGFFVDVCATHAHSGR
jgi:hypothetical protein